MGFARAIRCNFDKWTSQFEEPVAVYCTKDDAERVERIGTVRATVIIGSGLSQGAGAQIHAETADRFSVVVRSREWWSAFNFEPRFGMQFEVAAPAVSGVGADMRLRLVVKGVTRGETDFTCRCTLNQRVTE